MMPMPVPYPFNPVLGPRQHLPAFVSPKMPSSPVKTPPVVRSPIPIGAISPNNKRGGSPVVAGSGSSPGASQYTVVSVTRPGPSTPTRPISPQGKGMQVNTTPTHSPREPISSAQLQGPALPHPIPRLGYPGIPHGPLITPYGTGTIPQCPGQDTLACRPFWGTPSVSAYQGTITPCPPQVPCLRSRPTSCRHRPLVPTGAVPPRLLNSPRVHLTSRNSRTSNTPRCIC